MNSLRRPFWPAFFFSITCPRRNPSILLPPRCFLLRPMPVMFFTASLERFFSVVLTSDPAARSLTMSFPVLASWLPKGLERNEGNSRRMELMIMPIGPRPCWRAMPWKRCISPPPICWRSRSKLVQFTESRLNDNMTVHYESNDQ